MHSGQSRPISGHKFVSPESQFYLKIRISFAFAPQLCENSHMSAEQPISTAPSSSLSEAGCHIFKVGLSVPSNEQISHCVGLGVGPSEDAFREWLHRRMLLSQVPFLWAQVDPVQLDKGSNDLERLMHMVAYAGGCSPFRQVFWSGEEISLPESSERFFQGVATGHSVVPGGACALLLAGKAVADMKLAGPVPRVFPGRAEPVALCADRPTHGTVKEAPMPWMAGLMAMAGTMRRKLSFLWMAW
jgi:hypothetical protein